MAKFSIEGSWVGKVMYGSSFPAEYKTKTLSFRMTISSANNHISGDCEDDTTKELSLKPATIEGTYKDEYIHFVKRYPCLVMLDENNILKPDPTKPSIAIEYIGRRYWKLFSKKNYFKGNWNISGFFPDKKGTMQPYTVGGKWKMERDD